LGNWTFGVKIVRSDHKLTGGPVRLLFGGVNSGMLLIMLVSEVNLISIGSYWLMKDCAATTLRREASQKPSLTAAEIGGLLLDKIL